MNKTTTEELFRQQAIEALSKRPFGRPIARLPRSWSWATGLVVCVSIAAAGFLSQAEYARKESVRGWLVASNGVARISHDRDAEVAAIMQEAGKAVKAGDPVLTLGHDRFLDDGSDLNALQQEELRAQIAAVTAQVSLLHREGAVEARSIDEQLAALEVEQRLSDEQQQKQQQRISVATKKLERLANAAASGAVTEWEVLQQQDDLTGLQQTLTSQRQADIARLREQQRLEERSRRLPLETGRAVAALKGQRSALQQALSRQRAEQRVVLVAPVSGKLASIEVHVGDSIAPRQLLATVVTANPSLNVDVFVPSSAIGFIRTGQPVRLHYDALPHQHFGAFVGHVEAISDAVLLPHELPRTFHFSEAAFKVRITVQHSNAELEALRATLRPGMLLNAEIILESRSLVEWLLEPLRLRQRQAA